MKHILLPILLLALLLPMTALAYDFEVGGIYYDINGSEATVAQSPSYSYHGSVVIPSSVTYGGTTYAVTAIGTRAFYGCYVSSVSMPNTILEIGEKAFYYCEDLTSITIPNSVVTIGKSAFYCPAMTSATIGNAVTTIGDQAFYYCENLADVTMGNSVITIGEYAFCGTALTSITIPASVTTIGRNAFLGCEFLERVNITDLTAWCNIEIKGIDANPLYNAHHLYLNGSEVTNLVIPSGVTTIKSYSFYGCTGLTSVSIPSGVTTIKSWSFTECRNITSVNIPNTVTTIGGYAFSECNSLKSVLIPKSVTTLGTAVFDGTRDMTRMVVASGNPVYDSRNNCNAIIETATNTLVEGCNTTVIPNTVTAIAELAFSYRYTLSNLAIPNSVTSIDNQAFIGCKALTSIHIPASLVTINYSPFQDCDNLASITVASDNPVYDSRDNCNAIIETATNKLKAGCQTTIIPNTVTIIDRYAFSYCTNLEEISIPNSVTFIDQMAFEYCAGLKSVHIPNSVTAIGNWVFIDCELLSDVYSDIENPSAIEMGTYVFSGYHGGSDYTGRTLHVPAGSVEAYQADTKWSNFFERIVANVLIGDVDGDGTVSIADVTELIDLVLAGNASIEDYPGSDVDGNGTIGISDVTELIDSILMGL